MSSADASDIPSFETPAELDVELVSAKLHACRRHKYHPSKNDLKRILRSDTDDLNNDATELASVLPDDGPNNISIHLAAEVNDSPRLSRLRHLLRRSRSKDSNNMQTLLQLPAQSATGTSSGTQTPPDASEPSTPVVRNDTAGSSSLTVDNAPEKVRRLQGTLRRVAEVQRKIKRTQTMTLESQPKISDVLIAAGLDREDLKPYIVEALYECQRGCVPLLLSSLQLTVVQVNRLWSAQVLVECTAQL